jgi:hypothetical protein
LRTGCTDGERRGVVAEGRTFWETIKVEGGELLEKVKALIHEGNVRRIIIRQGDRSVAEFPLTVGLVGTVAAPVLAAVGALAALLTNCSIAVEREVAAAKTDTTPPAPPTDVVVTDASGGPSTEPVEPPPVA